MRDSRAGASLRSLRLQNYWSWGGGERGVFLLRALRQRKRRHGRTRPRQLSQLNMAQGKGQKRKLRPAQKQQAQPGRESKMEPKRGTTLHPPAWSELIPRHQWAIYRHAIEAARDTGLPFMLGGGFGLAAYIGHWRNTKDIDLYILPESRQPFIEALAKAGFADYHDQLPYDRGWIYRSYRQGVIVDLIWSMANRRAQADESWFKNSKPMAIRDEVVQVIPAEELLWCKLYVFQRDHCDWPDVFNLLYA